jgi:hypothetical protein
VLLHYELGEKVTAFIQGYESRSGASPHT